MVFQQIRHLFITLDASDKATKKLKQVDRTTNAVSASQQRAAERTRVFRKRLVAAGFGAAILTGTLASMVNATKEVDRTFARTAATSGATAEEMDKIRAAASNIGAEMPVLMGDAADAFEQLSFAGFSVEEQLSAASDVVELAVAGNIGMAESARLASSTVRAFGKQADETTQITNTMSATFTNSATTIQEMGAALEYVSASASQADQSVSEIIAAIGVLGDVGIRGTRAGTALERMMTQLAKRTGATKQSLDRLNLTIDDLTDSSGDFLDMSQIVQILNASINELGVGGAETLKIMQQLFGARGGRAAQALVNNTDEFITKIGDNARAEIKATMLMLDEMGSEEIATINNRLKNTLGAIEGLNVNITSATETEDLLEMMMQASESLSDAELAGAIDDAFDGISGRSAEIIADDVDSLRRLRMEAEAMSDQELSSAAATEFGLDENTADQMAAAIRSGTGIAKLTESIDSMGVQSELSDRQMESLWGQVEYLKGSISSLVVTMVTGMKPALDVFFSGAKAVVNILNENQRVAQGLGLGLALLTGTLLFLTAVYAKLAIHAHLTAVGFFESASASYVSAAANKAQTASAGLLAAAQNGVLIATIKQTAAQWYNIASKKASRAVNFAVIASSLLLHKVTLGLAGANRFEANMRALGNNHKYIAAIRNAAVTASSIAAKVATLGLAGAVGVLTGAFVAFQQMTIVGQIIAIVLGLVLLTLTIGQLTGEFISFTDILGGLGDAVTYLLSPLGMLGDALSWTWLLLKQIVSISIDAFMGLLSDSVDATTRSFERLGRWMMNLPLIGPVITAALGAVAQTLEWVNDQGEKTSGMAQTLSDAWAALGLAIGDAIRGTMTLLAPLSGAWGKFEEALGKAHTTTAVFIENGLGVLETKIDGVIGHMDSLKQALIVLTAIFFLPLTAIAAVAYGIYRHWDQITAAIDSGVSTIEELLGSLFLAFESVFPNAGGIMRDFGDQVNQILDKASRYLDGLGNVARNVANIIVDVAAVIGNLGIAVGILAGLLGQEIIERVTPYWNDLVDFAADTKEDILDEWRTFKLGVSKYIDDVVADLEGLYNDYAHYFDVIGDAVSLGLYYWDQFVEGVIHYVNVAIGGVGSFADAMMTIFVGIGTSIAAIVNHIIFGPFVWLIEGLAGITAQISQWTSGLTEITPEDMVDRFLEWSMGLPSAIADGIGAKADEVPGAIGDLFGQVVPFMPGSDADTGPLSNLTSWGAAIPRTIARGVGGASSMVTNSIKGALGSAGSTAWNIATGLGSKIAGGVTSGIENGAQSITGAVGSAVGIAKKAGSTVRSATGAARGLAMKTPGGRAIGAMGGMARDASGLALRTPVAMTTGGAVGTGQSILNDTTIEVHFDGEVHDAQKVEDMVRSGMEKASKEAEGRISDGLDMATDSIGGLF